MKAARILLPLSLLSCLAALSGACRPIDQYNAEHPQPHVKQAEYQPDKCDSVAMVQWYPSWRVDNSNVCPF